MFAVETLVAAQKNELKTMLTNGQHDSRSLTALAKRINESEETTEGRLADIGASVHHRGGRTGRAYYAIQS